jgi:hypothetical protein
MTGAVKECHFQPAGSVTPVGVVVDPLGLGSGLELADADVDGDGEVLPLAAVVAVGFALWCPGAGDELVPGLPEGCPWVAAGDWPPELLPGVGSPDRWLPVPPWPAAPLEWP